MRRGGAVSDAEADGVSSVDLSSSGHHDGDHHQGSDSGGKVLRMVVTLALLLVVVVVTRAMLRVVMREFTEMEKTIVRIMIKISL